jgi:hypothetical protein
MKENSIISKRQINKIISIYDDDVKVVDFLADLKDREPIHGLEKFVKWGNHESALLLYNCPLDDLVVLILYKSPFGFNQKGNNLMVYAHNSLRDMIKYFKSWHEATNDGAESIHLALGDITMLLYSEWSEEHDRNTQTNFLG